jgi:hypothetical protein
MKPVRLILASALLASLGAGCTHPMRKLENVRLGMEPTAVREAMGKPYAVRAAKVFQNEETTSVWEYWPPFFSLNDNKVHVVFENDKVVQWGIPGDYNTGSYTSIREYKEAKVK